MTAHNILIEMNCLRNELSTKGTLYYHEQEIRKLFNEEYFLKYATDYERTRITFSINDAKEKFIERMAKLRKRYLSNPIPSYQQQKWDMKSTSQKFSEMRRAVANNLWITELGEYIKLREMSDDFLISTLEKLQLNSETNPKQKYSTGTDWIIKLREEIQVRMESSL